MAAAALRARYLAEEAALTWIERSLRAKRVDGWIGPIDLRALRELTDYLHELFLAAVDAEKKERARS